MFHKRLIPTLLILESNLVKTQRFKNPRYIGDPLNTLRLFNDKEVDEIILIDIGASKMGRAPNYKLIEELASECFVPLTYGGGIRSLDDAKRIVSLGVEKICIQSAAFKNPYFISELSNFFGSSSVVVSLDFKRSFFGNTVVRGVNPWHAATRSLSYWCDIFEAHGAGELLVTNVDLEGMRSCPDISIFRDLVSSTSVPVTAQGGVARLEDVERLFSVGVSAVAAGAYFIYQGPHNAVLVQYPDRQEIESVLFNGISK